MSWDDTRGGYSTGGISVAHHPHPINPKKREIPQSGVSASPALAKPRANIQVSPAPAIPRRLRAKIRNQFQHHA
jgi:hypothetical protein